MIASGSLFAVCITCYILLILLFIKPEVYHLDSFLHPNTGTIKPTVAVGIVTAVFTGATSAFVTRCVEQSLWLKLSSPDIKQSNTLTIRESHRLAQWAVSPLERIIIYPFLGKSWLLKFGGMLLFGTVAINPVLLAGISQKFVVTTRIERQPNTVDMVTNRLDQGNIRYRGGSAHDNPTVIAAVAEMANLTASILNLCDDANCQISALTTALRADCQSSTASNPNKIGVYNRTVQRYPFCSSFNPDVCVTLVSASPYTYANFTSGYHPDCVPSRNFSSSSCAPGAWSTLFGVWVNGADVSSNSEYTLQTVDCLLTFGNITVSQNGTEPPILDRSDFVRANWNVSGSGNSGWMSMNRIYTESGYANSPYTFSGSAVGTGGNTLYNEVLGYYLLGYDANNDAETVARQIERNFDRATLTAFARLADASDITLTLNSATEDYVYNPRVLLVLLIPLFATLLSAWGRWSIGDEKRVIFYSPVENARRGPVLGLPQGLILNEKERETIGKWKIWGTREDVIGEDGRRGVRMGFAAGNYVQPTQGAYSLVSPTEADDVLTQQERPKGSQ